MSENNNNYNIGNADESIESLLSGKRRGVPQGGAGVPPRRDTSAARQYGAGTAGPYGSAPRRPSGERIQAPQSGAGMRI
ncbi:MAG: hypothetical protein IKN38_08705, partial [Clostridia bacterium]|nr:hypothetical protein [Clostridia bacterium]